jgi:hypothetical protein
VSALVPGGCRCVEPTFPCPVCEDLDGDVVTDEDAPSLDDEHARMRMDAAYSGGM